MATKHNYRSNNYRNNSLSCLNPNVNYNFSEINGHPQIMEILEVARRTSQMGEISAKFLRIPL